MVFWLVTAPRKGSPDDTWNMVRRGLGDGSIANVSRFSIPSLKVGTFDQLISLSDDLAKLDPHTEALLRKIERQYGELMESPSSSSSSDKTGGGGGSNNGLTKKGLTGPGGCTADDYARGFKWDEFRYPSRAGIAEIRSRLSQQAEAVDKELKELSSSYMGLKQALGTANRAAGGTLLVKPLAPYVEQAGTSRVVVETEHLTTLFAVIPSHAQREWEGRYETLCDWVVPRSSVSLCAEGDLELRTVVVFRQVARDFKRLARELRVTVRELAAEDRAALGITSPEDEEQTVPTGEGSSAASPGGDGDGGPKLSKEEQRAALADRVDDAWAKLVRWCATNYEEVLQGWMHVKAARAFVESVLRYGLPVDFEAVLVEPSRKGERKCRAQLDAMFAHLGHKQQQQGSADEPGALDALAGVGAGDAFYAYVSLTIAMDAEESMASRGR